MHFLREENQFLISNAKKFSTKTLTSDIIPILKSKNLIRIDIDVF